MQKHHARKSCTLSLVVGRVRTQNDWNSKLLELETFGTQNFWNSTLLELNTFGTQNFWNSALLELRTFGMETFWIEYTFNFKASQCRGHPAAVSATPPLLCVILVAVWGGSKIRDEGTCPSGGLESIEHTFAKVLTCQRFELQKFWLARKMLMQTNLIIERTHQCEPGTQTSSKSNFSPSFGAPLSYFFGKHILGNERLPSVSSL